MHEVEDPESYTSHQREKPASGPRLRPECLTYSAQSTTNLNFTAFLRLTSGLNALNVHWMNVGTL